MQVLRGICLVCLSAAGIASASESASPCADQYADWVAEPSAFVRTDEPKHLQGLHVVCVWRLDASDPVNFEAFPNAVDLGTPPPRFELRPEASQSWRDFRRELRLALRIKKRSNDWEHLELKQPYGIFASSGKRLASVEEVLEAQLLLVTEGGQWFWPPIRKGFVRQVSDGLELETMSVQPVLFRVRGFLRDEECTEIVKVADGRMASGKVTLMDKDKGKAAAEFRTSTQAHLTASESKYLTEINYRIARLTHVPLEHNEDVQVLRYQKSQYYSAHMDQWDPKFYSGPDAAFMEGGHNNRLLTVFWYLTNVADGGETLFPRADGLPSPTDNYACDQGLKIKPERGAVIFWYSLRPNGNGDENGAHAACKVLGTEEKWSANYWVWNKPRMQGAPMPDGGVDEAEPEEGRQGAGSGENTNAGPPDGGRTPVVATFKNQHATEPVDMFYVSAQDSSETAMGAIPPGEEATMNTMPGHIWVFKTSPGSSQKWSKQVTITGDERQEFSFNPRGSKEDL